MSERVCIPIEGMTCASCVAHITKAVRRLNGVEKVRVDLGSDSATVAFDPVATSIGAIATAIRSAGYEPRVEALTALAAPEHPGFLSRLRKR